MNQIIHAREEIGRCPWLPQKIKEMLDGHSVAVNSLFTPLDEDNLIDSLVESEMTISQIAYAHEVPPYFTRKGQYFTAESTHLDEGKNDIDIAEPGLYGFIRHPNSTYTLVMFIRGQVINLSIVNRPRIDPEGKNIRGVFDQYRRLVTQLLRRGVQKPVLRVVGTLPGYAQRHFEKGKLIGYDDEVRMMRENNDNSARFVIEATRQTLRRFGLMESEMVILGSAGTLGREVAKHFGMAMKLDMGPKNQLPQMKNHLVLDMTGGGSLEYYSNQVSNTTIWLNESFPPPLGKGSQLGNSPKHILHIQGVNGNIVPSFPYGYGDIPPCCMGLDEQSADTVSIMEIL